jgi:hypothetical protein
LSIQSETAVSVSQTASTRPTTIGAGLALRIDPLFDDSAGLDGYFLATEIVERLDVLRVAFGHHHNVAGRHVGHRISNLQPLFGDKERRPHDVATARRQIRDQGVEAGVLDLELKPKGLGDGARAVDIEANRLVWIGHACRGEVLHGRVLDIDAVSEDAGLDQARGRGDRRFRTG